MKIQLFSEGCPKLQIHHRNANFADLSVIKVSGINYIRPKSYTTEIKQNFTGDIEISILEDNHNLTVQGPEQPDLKLDLLGFGSNDTPPPPPRSLHT